MSSVTCDFCGCESDSNICQRCESYQRWAASNPSGDDRMPVTGPVRRSETRTDGAGSRARVRLREALEGLPAAYSDLRHFRLPGSRPPDPDAKPSGKRQSSRPPLVVDVIDLEDQREKADADATRADYDLDRRAGARRQGVLPTLACWVRLVDGELWDDGIEHDPPADNPTVTTECGFLLTHIDWIGEQQWLGEITDDIAAMLDDVRHATGWRPDPNTTAARAAGTLKAETPATTENSPGSTAPAARRRGRGRPARLRCNANRPTSNRCGPARKQSNGPSKPCGSGGRKAGSPTSARTGAGSCTTCASSATSRHASSKGSGSHDCISRPAKRCADCGKQAWSGSPCQCAEPKWVIDNSPLHSFQAWCQLWAAECLRILKPGGHLLAFGGTRTSHRLACAIEDAGFEIRDSIAWLYGVGFPKSLDVSKAIDKAAGTEREIIGNTSQFSGRTVGRGNSARGGYEGGEIVSGHCRDITAPATPEAARWQGWGTALKPAHETIIVARKPLQGTVAANVQRWGTGALNIDATRIGTDENTGRPTRRLPTGSEVAASTSWMRADREQMTTEGNPAGRWPANVVLDESQAEALDQMTADLDDERGASRFMYTAKASAEERIHHNGTTHPTVKPLSLMRWLVKLVTTPGGVCLEPFAGSGTTVEACILEGFKCVAIEREAEYLPLITQRINRRLDPVAYLRDGGHELGLFDDGLA
jgi:hypothetical protein